MKKTLLFLAFCLLSVCMMAQAIDVIKPATNKLKAQMSNIPSLVQNNDRSYIKALDEGQYLCGLYTTDDLAEYGSGMGAYTSGICKAATIFDKSITENFNEFKVVGMRVGLCYDITDFDVFVSKINNNGSISTIKSKEVGKGIKGWNTVMFDEGEQFTLSSKETYMVGFTYYQKNDKDPKNPQYYTDECYPISYYEKSDIKGDFYFYGNIPRSVGGSGLAWYTLGNDGALSVQLIVEGNLSDQRIILSNLKVDKGYYQKDDKIIWSIDVTNMGKDAIESVGFNIYIDNDLVNTAKASKSISPTKKATISSAIGMPSDIKLLGHTLKVELTSVNGNAPSGEVDNNNATAQFNVYSNAVPRQKHLIEHFTSNSCTYCPLGYTMMRLMVEKHDDVAWVSIHGNMNGVDPLNFKECDQIQTMEGLGGWPGASFNRIFDEELADGDKTLVYGIGYNEQYIPEIMEEFYKFMKNIPEPSFVTLDIEQSFEPKRRDLEITVKGKGVEGASMLLADYALTIYITESGLKGRQLNQGKWENNYEHNNALRMVATSVGGESIKWTGDDFTIFKSLAIPEEFVAENLTITAFVAPIVKDINNADIYHMALNNCEQAAVSTNTSIQGVQSDNVSETARYTIDGQLISSPQKGLNIVKMSDGSTHKVIVR